MIFLQDFDKVWPIFDSAQSRDFRKVNFEIMVFCLYRHTRIFDLDSNCAIFLWEN